MQVPKMDNSGTILLSDSRHPVIERIQAGFVPNDIGVKKGELCIITGPNMVTAKAL